MENPRKRNSFSKLVLVSPCLLTLATLGVFSGPSYGENLVSSGEYEVSSEEWLSDIDNVIRMEFDEKRGGDSSLGLQYSAWVLSPELVEVNPDGIYLLSAFFKRPEVNRFGSASQKVTYQLAFKMYDVEDKPIGAMAVSPVEGSELRLTADAEEGSLEVRVDGAPWERKTVGNGTPYDAIAFDVQYDYSDLPNHANYMIESITEDEGGSLIQLRQPLEQSYPAETPVRQHAHAEAMQVGGVASPEWTESSLEVTGVSEPGTVARNKFWPGTKKIRVAIRASGSEGQAVDLLVDDVTLREN